jgi:YHS domain-containing protein
MMTKRPDQLIDPVCGMTVDVARAEERGLLLEHEGRTFAFCGPGCRRSFVEEPAGYLAEAEAAAMASPKVPHPAHDAAGGHVPAEQAPLVIDAGLRLWYESCSCCLSEAYPEVKAQLDAEKAAAGQAAAAAGICEVAEPETATIQ